MVCNPTTITLTHSASWAVCWPAFLLLIQRPLLQWQFISVFADSFTRNLHGAGLFNRPITQLKGVFHPGTQPFLLSIEVSAIFSVLFMSRKSELISALKPSPHFAAEDHGNLRMQRSRGLEAGVCYCIFSMAFGNWVFSSFVAYRESWIGWRRSAMYSASRKAMCMPFAL